MEKLCDTCIRLDSIEVTFQAQIYPKYNINKSQYFFSEEYIYIFYHTISIFYRKSIYQKLLVKRKIRLHKTI